MLIKVFNAETAKVEKIESGKLDIKIHTHRNSHRVFTAEELKNFGVIGSTEKPLEKLNKEALLVKVAGLELEGITEENTKAEIILAINEAK